MHPIQIAEILVLYLIRSFNNLAIEPGILFSDPSADGTIIQATSEQAVHQVNLDLICLLALTSIEQRICEVARRADAVIIGSWLIEHLAEQPIINALTAARQLMRDIRQHVDSAASTPPASNSPLSSPPAT